MPFAPSSVLVTTSKALVTRSDALAPSSDALVTTLALVDVETHDNPIPTP